MAWRRTHRRHRSRRKYHHQLPALLPEIMTMIVAVDINVIMVLRQGVDVETVGIVWHKGEIRNDTNAVWNCQMLYLSGIQVTDNESLGNVRPITPPCVSVNLVRHPVVGAAIRVDPDIPKQLEDRQVAVEPPHPPRYQH